jgi:hypothetical protein
MHAAIIEWGLHAPLFELASKESYQAREMAWAEFLDTHGWHSSWCILVKVGAPIGVDVRAHLSSSEPIVGYPSGRPVVFICLVTHTSSYTLL